MARALAIDLGSYAVKVAVLEGGFGRYTLTRFLEGRVHPLAEGAEGDPSFLALEELLAGSDLGPIQATFMSWPSERASVRVVDLPFTDRNQIAKTLPFEVENLVPFDLEDMVLDHRILGADGGQSHVLAVLANAEEVRGHLATCSAHKLDPRSLSVDGDVLGAFGTSGVQAVVDIGHQRILTSLVVDGQTYAVRAVEGGGKDLDRRLMSAFGLSEADAEAWKLHAGLEGAVAPERVGGEEAVTDAGQEHSMSDEQRVRRVLLGAVKELVADVRATLVAFEDELGREVDEVLLAGGTSAMTGLGMVMAEELGVPVRPVPMGDKVPTEGHPSRFALAHALGQRASGDARLRALDLRKGDLAFHGHLDFMRGLVAYGVAALAFFALAGLVVFFNAHHKLVKERGIVEASITSVVLETFPDVDKTKLKEPSMALAIMQERANLVITRVEALSAILKAVPPTLLVLKEVSAAMPPPDQAVIDVKEMTITPEAINIRADTTGYEAVAKIQSGLQSNPRFKAAEKGDEKKVGDRLSFTMNIPLTVSGESMPAVAGAMAPMGDADQDIEPGMPGKGGPGPMGRPGAGEDGKPMGRPGVGEDGKPMGRPGIGEDGKPVMRGPGPEGKRPGRKAGIAVPGQEGEE